MSNDVILVDDWKGNDNLPLTKRDLDALTEKRKVLKEFVQSQLKEGIDNDYGIIPGTGNKKALFQPGGEKLQTLFGLGTRMSMISNIFDRIGNFSMYVYQCEVYHLKSGIIITQVEGSVNSQEKKYATRAKWEKRGSQNVKVGDEPVPITDIDNTLRKMAQKRAFLGAIIRATNASDFFTSDFETAEDFKNQTGAPVIKDGEQPINFQAKGDTNTHKDQLKKYGGRWNPTDKGWDFKNVAPELKTMISGLKGIEINELN